MTEEAVPVEVVEAVARAGPMREIDSNIPLPQGRGPGMRFPELLGLEVGQSFLVDPSEADAAQRALWQQHRTRKDRRYTTAMTNKGRRIWRKS